MFSLTRNRRKTKGYGLYRAMQYADVHTLLGAAARVNICLSRTGNSSAVRFAGRCADAVSVTKRAISNATDLTAATHCNKD